MIIRGAILFILLAGAGFWAAEYQLSTTVPVAPSEPVVTGDANVRTAPSPTSPALTLEKKGAPGPKKSLTHYHTAAVEAFQETPGFGLGRMQITERKIEDVYVFWSPGELEQDAPPLKIPELVKVHSDRTDLLFGKNTPAAVPAALTSTNADGARERWRLQSIDLLALIEHDRPVVYVTEKLVASRGHGAAKKTGAVPDKANYARELDFLEHAALEKLTAGDDLYVRSKENTLRMVGALRANKQCLDCHAGKEGDLFGAFSYTLRKADGKN